MIDSILLFVENLYLKLYNNEILVNSLLQWLNINTEVFKEFRSLFSKQEAT